MVAEGKLYRPGNYSVSIRLPNADFSLTNIACGVIGGGSGELSDGIKGICGAVGDQGSKVTLLDVSAFIKDGVCQGNRACDFIGQVFLKTAGGFIEDGIAEACLSIFDVLNSHCPGQTGGVAEITINDSEGQQTGTVEGDFYDHDGGLTCPANNDISVCVVRRFG
jgi:hypothetical protein